MLLTLPQSSEQSFPLLPLNPNAPAPVANPKRPIFEEVVGNFGCFPGRISKRLDLSPYDKTHTYSIALLNEADVCEREQNSIWVYVLSSTGPVAANVASIAKRLHFSDKYEVIDLASREGQNPAYTALEESIQAKMDAFEKDFETLQKFFSDIRNCFRQTRKIEDVLINSEWDLEINNPDIKALSKKFLKDCCTHIMTSDTSLQLNSLLKQFKSDLKALNENFAFFIREKVVEDSRLWGAYEPNLLKEAGAKKIDKESTCEVAVRLKIDLKKDMFNRYAIKTDGYIYYDKPEMTKDCVPYSRDGKIWVMLKTLSLHYRTGISVEAINAAAAKDSNVEGGLFLLVRDEINLLSQGSLYSARVGPELGSPFLLSRHYDWIDIFCQITQHLPLESLKALDMVNSEHKPDVDVAVMAEAWIAGYEGEDINEANQFLKNDRIEMQKEMIRFREKFPIYVLLYKELYRYRTGYSSGRKWDDLFDFGGKKFPYQFFKVVNTLNERQLVFLFSDIPYLSKFAPKLAKKLLKDRGGEVLRLAINQGEKEVAIKLLKSGVETNTFDNSEEYKGYSPLHFAVIKSYECICWLCKYGADVNIRGFEGNTPLHLAILKSCARSVEALLTNNAEYDIKNDHGETAIDFLNEVIAKNLWFDAVAQEYRKTILFLVEYGFNVNTIDIAGNTGLHLAALNGRYQVMQYILTHGKDVDLTIRNLPGDRVCDIVKRHVSLGNKISCFIIEALGIETPFVKSVKAFSADEGDL